MGRSDPVVEPACPNTRVGRRSSARGVTTRRRTSGHRSSFPEPSPKAMAWNPAALVEGPGPAGCAGTCRAGSAARGLAWRDPAAACQRPVPPNRGARRAARSSRGCRCRSTRRGAPRPDRRPRRRSCVRRGSDAGGSTRELPRRSGPGAHRRRAPCGSGDRHPPRSRRRPASRPEGEGSARLVHGGGAVLYRRRSTTIWPSFITTSSRAGSCRTRTSRSGSPSTTRRSASLPRLEGSQAILGAERRRGVPGPRHQGLLGRHAALHHQLELVGVLPQ